MGVKTYLINISNPGKDNSKLIDTLHNFGEVEFINANQYFLRSENEVSQYKQGCLEGLGCEVRRSCGVSLEFLL